MSHDSALRSLFETIAPNYEAAVIPLFGPLAASLVASIPALVVAGRVLDLGTGTGIMARLLADRFERVYGLDRVNDMLLIARQTSPQVRFVQGDIHHLPFAAESFDLITASFGLNATDPRRTFGQISRLLKPGGWLIFQEWGPIDAASDAFEEALAEAVPESVLEQVGDQNSEIETLFAAWERSLQDVDDYRGLLAERGFAQNEVTEGVLTRSRVGSLEQFIDYKLAWLPRQRILAALNDVQRAEVLDALRVALVPYVDQDDGFSWEPPLFRVWARRG